MATILLSWVVEKGKSLHKHRVLDTFFSPICTHHLSKSHWMASIWVSHCRYRIEVYAFHKFSCPRFLNVIFHAVQVYQRVKGANDRKRKIPTLKKGSEQVEEFNCYKKPSIHMQTSALHIATHLATVKISRKRWLIRLQIWLVKRCRSHASFVFPLSR